MKTTINITAYPDDLGRYESANDLRTFYEQFGCSGLELMPANNLLPGPQVTPDMIIGIHCRCINDWMNLDYDYLIDHYRKDLDYAKEINAEYVVFHISQSSFKESISYTRSHTDIEVVDACCKLINDLLDNQNYSFYFLMENLWYPGLTFKDPKIPIYLLEQIHYTKKGFMLDTGHYMNTDTSLRTPNEALESLYHLLEKNHAIIPFIKGIHLNQSLSGEYVEHFKKHLPTPESDPDKLMAQAFEHIFKLDQHRPFAIPQVRDFIECIKPDYITYEYITNSRKQHAEFLELGSAPLR
ncbi:hypothetical protein P261_02321 [Lachnospiraceae bacterium TWA4]|nr:hypothetical protein P261_02321 [Lachnospiraceae bacterium TWA4]